jgi:hypothetical protein
MPGDGKLFGRDDLPLRLEMKATVIVGHHFLAPVAARADPPK